MERNSDIIQVRLATTEDAPAIAGVLQAAFVEFEPLYTPQGFATTTPPSDAIEKRFGEGPAWVALLDGAIVGTVSAVGKGERLYVRSMGVLPSARGKGVARLLMEHVDSYVAQHGYGRLFLSTTPFLDAAIALYESVGFRRTEEGPRDLFGTPLFTMEKRNDAAEGHD